MLYSCSLKKNRFFSEAVFQRFFSEKIVVNKLMNGRCQVGEQMVLYSWPVTVLSQSSYSNLKTSVGSSRQTLSHASSSLSFLTLSVPGRPNSSGGLLSSLHVSSSFQKSTAFLKPTLWTWVITVALLPESRHSRHSVPFLY